MPYIIAGSALILTVMSWFFTSRSVYLYNSARFKTFSDGIRDGIEYRMKTYINTLTQTKGMFAVTPYISRSSFRDYIKGLNVETQYRGLQALGVVERIRDYNLQSHISQARSEGFRDYKVWPLVKRSEYYSIINVEPMNDRYRKIIGFDLFTEPVRKEAMEISRDTGLPFSTKRVDPIMDAEDGTDANAFLIFTPLYKFKSNISTVEARRKNIVGFLYSPFRATPLFSDISNNLKNKNIIDFEVYIGNEFNEASLLYDQDKNPSFSANKFNPFLIKKFKLNVAGQNWNIVTYTLPGFSKNSYLWIPWVVLLVGFLISALLFKIMHNYGKHSELENIRSKELEKLNIKAQDAVASRDEFLSIASHELKTPLTTLKLQIQTMVRQIEKGTFATQPKDKIEKIASVFNQQLVRLTGLVDNLLDVSRARAGRLLLSKEELNVTVIIQGIVEKFRLQGMTSNTLIIFNAPDSIIGLFDSLRIEQITENLISNAAKYAPGKPIHVRLSREKNHLRFEVEDFGVGISEDNQLKIFELFERVSETSQAVSGLGLGLFITKQIIDAHGGSIIVQSKMGLGSTFTVELPIETTDMV